jgi:serine/threonine protein kinase
VIGGTPNYMPREQLTGQADHRADIFALGATFYELATGVLPGHPGVPAHKADSYPSPRQRVPTIPAKFSELLMHCLEPNAGDRPQDLPTILRELRTIRAELATPDVVVTPRREPRSAMAVEPTVVSKQRAPLPRISREDDDDAPRKNIVEVVDLGKKR